MWSFTRLQRDQCQEKRILTIFHSKKKTSSGNLKHGGPSDERKNCQSKTGKTSDLLVQTGKKTGRKFSGDVHSIW